MKLLEFNILNGWPASTSTFKYMQEQMLELQSLSFLGGALYVVAGCTTTGGIVSNGFVVVNGEVLRFVGGAAQANVVIVPTTTNRTFKDGQFNPYYKDRYATFGTAPTQFAWANFENKDMAKGMLQRLKEAEAAVAGLPAATDTAIAAALTAYAPAWASITGKPSGLHYATSYSLPQNGNIGGGVGNSSFPNSVSDTDSVYTILFPQLANTNYIVAGSLFNYEGDPNYSNDVMWVVADKQVGSFKLAIREMEQVEQKLKFDFAIIKL